MPTVNCLPVTVLAGELVHILIGVLDAPPTDLLRELSVGLNSDLEAGAAGFGLFLCTPGRLPLRSEHLIVSCTAVLKLRNSKVEENQVEFKSNILNL